MACINIFDTSHSGKRDTLSKQIWKWAQENENWLSATHIPGIQSTETDLESQKNESIPSGNPGKIYLTTFAHNYTQTLK